MQFELFPRDLDGGNIEQLTGFTSFAEFSPDGKKLVFNSDRNANNRCEFNVFVADRVE